VLAAFTLVALVLALAWRPLLVLVLIGLAVELVVRLLDEHVSRGEAVALGTGALVLCELIAWADSLRAVGAEADAWYEPLSVSEARPVGDRSRAQMSAPALSVSRTATAR